MIKRVLISTAALTMIFMFITSLYANDTEQKLFDEGNDLFLSKQYEEARASYEKLVSMGYNDPSLYFNLASTYVFLNEHGKAALYLHRAKRLQPRSEDIKRNLNVIESIGRRDYEPGEEDAAPSGEAAGSTVKRFVKGFSFLSKNEISVLIFFSYLFFFLWSLFRKFLKPGASKFFVGVLGTTSYLFSITFIFIFVTTFYYDSFYPESVVLETAELMSSPTDDDSYYTYVDVKAGTLVELKRNYNGWAEVTLVKGGETGWVRLDQIEKI
jgi:tetratricopeptide (TPR) repeat protein